MTDKEELLNEIEACDNELTLLKIIAMLLTEVTERIKYISENTKSIGDE